MPCLSTEWSAYTSQTNWTLGVKRAQAWYRLPSVSAPLLTLLLFTLVYHTDYGSFLLRLLLYSEITFKMFSRFAKANVSQDLAIYHELQVVTTVSLGHTEKPWRTQLEPKTPSDILFKHKRICVIQHFSYDTC